MIRHTVVFRLKHDAGSKEELLFLEAGKELANISTVKNFECLRQVSKKNNFDFGFSMEFDSQADYKYYNEHPDHKNFVESRWLSEVEEFLEIDYEVM